VGVVFVETAALDAARGSSVFANFVGQLFCFFADFLRSIAHVVHRVIDGFPRSLGCAFRLTAANRKQ
jgi:hypothetical protein